MLLPAHSIKNIHSSWQNNSQRIIQRQRLPNPDLNRNSSIS